MKLETEVAPYLEDKKFSPGLYLKIAKRQNQLPNRIDFICEFVKGKKVLHVGCLDHIPLVDQKIRNGLWLHKRIEEVASRQIGIDINKEGIEIIRKEKGYQNIYFEDIVSGDPVGDFISSDHWDVMVLGEILEHVNNPVDFLMQLKRKYAPFVSQILISVPNAFALENTLLGLRHKECINTDHRSWFSVYTLCKNLSIAGFGSFEFEFVTSYPQDFKNSYFKKTFLKRFPAFRSTIVMSAHFSAE